VLSSSPAAGAKVKAGTKVKLTVSAGTAPPPGANCTVPNVVGKTTAAASSALTAAKCAVGAITKKASKKPAGTVLSSSPVAGKKVNAGTKVKLTVSK
jgi:serine/threonine-protein kinase